jgi:hypothetical protein
METRQGRAGARHRRVVVAPRLDELHGPTSGVVELPNRLLWRPDRHVDLDNPAILAWMYAVVLREAATVDELRTWLDGDTLVRLWPEIYLPRWVRRAWRDRHPQLGAYAPASRSAPPLSA